MNDIPSKPSGFKSVLFGQLIDAIEARMPNSGSKFQVSQSAHGLSIKTPQARVDDVVECGLVEIAGDNSVIVNELTWAGTALTVDVGKTYKTLTDLTGNSKTYYVYVKKAGTTLTAEKSEARPFGQDVVLLAIVTTGTTGVIGFPVQRHLGDIYTVFFPKPFDLVDVVADSFSVMVNGAKTAAVWIAGKPITAIGVSGITFDTDRWKSGVIAASQAVWLELDRQANAVTIYMGTAFPDGTASKYDYTEIHPLWWIPFASSAITTSGIIDYRDAIRLPAMA
jgi:hypothetical protein